MKTSIMDDIKVQTTKRVVCRHGADNYLTFETTRTETGYTVKATECICKACLAEMARGFVSGQ